MSRGGTNNHRNMVLSCAQCNKIKGRTLLKSKKRKFYRDRLQAKDQEARAVYNEKGVDLDYKAELGAFYRNNFD